MTRHELTNIAACAVLWIVLAGCNAGPVVAPGRVENSPANVAEWDEAGNVRSVLQGGFPAQIETSADGANIQASGQPRVLTFSITLPDGTRRVATLADPSDTELTGFRMDADGSITLDTFGAQASTVLAVQNEAIIQSLLTTEKITAEQAAVIRHAIQSGASLAEAIARVAAEALVPTP